MSDETQRQESPEVTAYRRRHQLRLQRPTEIQLFGTKTEGAFNPLGKPARALSRELPQMADLFARKQAALELWAKANDAEAPETLMAWLNQAVGIRIDTKPAEGEDGIVIEQPGDRVVLQLGPFSGQLEYYQLEGPQREDLIARLQAKQH